MRVNGVARRQPRMQKLAIIADIHGNVAALEAVLADIRALGVADIVNLGDCVSGPLWPRETMAELQRLALPTVRGNHDRWLGEVDRASMGPSDAFAFDQLTAAQIASLGRLPPQLRLDLDVLAIHGTPRSDLEYLLEDVVEGRLLPAAADPLGPRLGELSAAVVLCGHSHQARVVLTQQNLLIINPGSVGCPGYFDPTPPAHVSEAGSPHARYGLLQQAGSGWRVDLMAVPYDWSAASRRAAENGRDEWARALATGFLTERAADGRARGPEARP
jgi:predicted phosphodiesterase